MVLVDEFSTGIDAKMKRDMWGVLRAIAVGKSVVITTRKADDPFTLGAHTDIGDRFDGRGISTGQ